MLQIELNPTPVKLCETTYFPQFCIDYKGDYLPADWLAEDWITEAQSIPENCCEGQTIFLPYSWCANLPIVYRVQGNASEVSSFGYAIKAEVYVGFPSWHGAGTSYPFTKVGEIVGKPINGYVYFDVSKYVMPELSPIDINEVNGFYPFQDKICRSFYIKVFETKLEANGFEYQTETIEELTDFANMMTNSSFEDGLTTGWQVQNDEINISAWTSFSPGSVTASYGGPFAAFSRSKTIYQPISSQFLNNIIILNTGVRCVVRAKVDWGANDGSLTFWIATRDTNLNIITNRVAFNSIDTVGEKLIYAEFDLTNHDDEVLFWFEQVDGENVSVGLSLLQYGIVNYQLGVNAVNQLGDPQGSNLGEYTLSYSDDFFSYGQLAKWLTPWISNSKFFSGYPFFYSTIFTRNQIPNGSFLTLQIEELDKNGNVLDTKSSNYNYDGSAGAIELPGYGVYRWMFQDETCTLDPLTTQLKIKIPGEEDYTKTLTVDVVNQCNDYPLYLVWLNHLGGWDGWLFNNPKQNSVAIEARTDIKRDAKRLGNWSNDFKQGKTELDYLKVDAYNEYVITASPLTKTDALNLKGMLASPKVYKVERVLNQDGSFCRWKYTTVLITDSSIGLFADNDKFAEVQVTIRDTYNNYSQVQ